MKKQNKWITLVAILLIILSLIVFSLFIISNTKLLNNLFGIKIKQENEREIPLFSYIVYDNQDEQNIKVLITVNSGNGLEYIEYPNGTIVNTYGKNTISVDYLATKDKKYTFGIKEIDTNKIEQEMIIDDDKLDTQLEIKKVTDVSGYKIIEIDKYINIGDYGNISYKIGENGNWVNATEKAKFSMLDYDLTQNKLINDDNTVTIYAKITDNLRNYEIITNKKYNINPTENVASLQAESLLQAIKDNNFENGKYEVTVSDEIYNLKVYNINSSVDMSIDTTIGVEEDVCSSETYAQNMIVVKVTGDLTISEDAIITSYGNTTSGPKGLMIYCTGTLTNDGTISMTGKGANNPEGQNVYLWKNADNTYEYIPKTGGDGGAGGGYGSDGNRSTVKRGLAGGGSGNGYRYSGPGGDGTSWGSGSGGIGQSGDGRSLALFRSTCWFNCSI